MRNAALQRGTAPLFDSRERGSLLENLVATSVRAPAVRSMVRLHYRRSGNNEVDLIYDDPRQPLALEVAGSVRHTQRGLSALLERHGQFRGNACLVAPQATVIHPGDTRSGIGTLPIDTFLPAVSAQAEQALARQMGQFRE